MCYGGVWSISRGQVRGERLEDVGGDARALRGVRAVRVVDHDRELLRRQVRGNPLVSVEDRVLQHPPIADGDPESVAELPRRTRQALRQILDLLAR